MADKSHEIDTNNVEEMLAYFQDEGLNLSVELADGYWSFCLNNGQMIMHQNHDLVAGCRMLIQKYLSAKSKGLPA